MMRRMAAGLALAGALALLAGCGGERAGDAASGAGSSAAAEGEGGAADPTPLTARFAQPTTIISITSSSAVTESAESAESAGTPEPAAASAEDLERGANLYATKGCAECHGDEGEGVEGKGAALAGTQLSEAEFEDVLRTGAKGELGNDHIYGPGALSPGGLKAMYAWVQSLAGQ